MSAATTQPALSRLWTRMAGSATAIVSALTIVVLSAGTVVAASPTPGVGGDPRSAGEGPGLMGDPAFAILAVISIGVGALVLTLAFIRLTGGRTR